MSIEKINRRNVKLLENDQKPLYSFNITEKSPLTLLDSLLYKFKDMKRSKLKQWLSHEAIKVNSVIQTYYNYSIEIGDEITITPYVLVKKQADKNGFSILYEDKSIVIVDQQTIPNPNRNPMTKLSSKNIKTPEHIIIHRIRYFLQKRNDNLKKPILITNSHHNQATGVYIYAKSEEFCQCIRRDWSSYGHTLICLCKGKFPSLQGTLTTSLSVLKTDKIDMIDNTVNITATMNAITHYRTLRQSNDGLYSVVEFSLGTCYKNQLFKQLKYNGIKIVGNDIGNDEVIMNPTYLTSIKRKKKISPADSLEIRRIESAMNAESSIEKDAKFRLEKNIGLGFHVHEIRMVHPLTKQSMTLTSEMPPLFYRYIDKYNVLTSVNISNHEDISENDDSDELEDNEDEDIDEDSEGSISTVSSIGKSDNRNLSGRNLKIVKLSDFLKSSTPADKPTNLKKSKNSR